MVRFSLAAIALVATTVMAAPVDDTAHPHAKRDEFMLELSVTPGSGSNNVNNAQYKPISIPTQLVDDLASEQGSQKSVRRSLYKPNSKPIKSGSGQAKYTLKTINGWREAVGSPPVEWDDQLAEQAKLAAKTSCFTNNVAISPDATWLAWVGSNQQEKQDWLAHLRAIFNRQFQTLGPDLDSSAIVDFDSYWKSVTVIRTSWKAHKKMGCGYNYCDESKPNHPREAKFFCLWTVRLPEYSDKAAYIENLPNRTVVESVDWSKVY